MIIMKLSAIALWAALGAVVAQDALEEGGCQTPPPNDCEKALMWLVDKRWEKQNAADRRLQEVGSIKVDVYFHALASEKSKDGELSTKQRDRLMNALTKGFKTTPFKFEFKETVTTRNDIWHECGDADHFKSKLRVGGRETLNVFLCDTRKLRKQITATYSIATPLVGIATYPHGLDQFGGGIAKDGVMLRHPGKRFLKAISGVVSRSSEQEILQTLPHEVGHWLGLLHTFEGGCSSSFAYNSYTNGAVGDGVLDTAAEIGPGWSNEGWENCFKKTKAPDTCSNKENGVDPGADPVQNFMDYIHPRCMARHGEFTAGQSKRMLAFWETYRVGKPLQRRRILQEEEDEEFFPDNELISTCVGTAVQQCKCKLDCYYRFRDLLRDFLPFDKFDGIKATIFDQCSACSEIGSDADCPKGEYCEFGNRKALGNRCVKKKINSEQCWTDSQCRSGHCVNGICSGCLLGEASDCNDRKFCGFHERDCPTHLVKGSTFADIKFFCAYEHKDGISRDISYTCLRKLELGDSCSSDDACNSGMCTGGRCSKCAKMDESEGCQSGKVCRFSYKRGHYRCKRNPTILEADKECPVPGSSDGCNRELQFCGNDHRCMDKILPVDQFSNPRPCWTNDMCHSGSTCLEGYCRQCEVLGSSKECLDPSREVCIDHRCERRKGDNLPCFFDLECKSNDCRSGKCYGECSKDKDCGSLFGNCMDQFCASSSGDNEPSYFNRYDCRLGSNRQRCQQCAQADWQCEGEQYCDGDLCVPKREGGGNCSRNAMCMSNSCSNARECSSDPECLRNNDCDEDQFCNGYSCQRKRQVGEWCTEHYICGSGACNIFSQRCEACRDSSACLDTEYCSFGNCQPKECSENSDCGDGKVCKVQGETPWTCVDCKSAADCDAEGKRFCDLSSNTCSECVIDANCVDSHYCRDEKCVTKQCASHADCTDEVRSQCDIGASWQCIECAADRDCTITNKPFCDLDSKACVPCTDKRGCEETQVCNLFTDSGDRCVDKECLTNKDCPEGKVCDPVGNACVDCFKDRQCESNQYCSLFGHCETKQCNVDSDCKRFNATPVCDNVRYFHCVECKVDTDCKGRFPACRPEDGRCIECSDHGDCLDTEFCSPVQDCRPKQCDSHSDCFDGFLCVPDDPSLDTFPFECKPCYRDEHCREPSSPVCDLESGCVACKKDADCPGNQECVASPPSFVNECRPSKNCLLDADCSGSKVCIQQELEFNQCKDCRDQSHCKENEYCEPRFGQYLCIRKQCETNDDCDDNLVCVNEIGPETFAPFTCLECVKSSDCPPEKPTCSGSQCMACFSDGDCHGDLSCDLSVESCDPQSLSCDNICRGDECAADADCTNPERPRCLDARESHFIKRNACVACHDDSHCPGDSDTYCETAAFICRSWSDF